MPRLSSIWWLPLVLLALSACDEPVDPVTRGWTPSTLTAPPNRIDELTFLAEAQPHRDHPRATLVAASLDRLFVALEGSVDDPGSEVIALDLAGRRVVQRYAVGSSPAGLALHPSERYLVVANRFSNYLSVIDLHTHQVSQQAADFYVTALAFSPDGDWLYSANRWRDTVRRWRVSADGGLSLAVDDSAAVPVGTNPDSVLVSPDGTVAWVASETRMWVTIIDTESMTVVGAIDPYSPPNGIALVGDRLVMATTSASSHHPALSGPDTDGDGVPGDGTPNQGFQDLQNEVAVYGAYDYSHLGRFTSDTICCFDYRDVRPDDETLGDLLPDSDEQVVGGALPEAVIALPSLSEGALAVLYSGSNEIQLFELTPSNRLEPGPILATGYQPVSMAVHEGRQELYVANRLGESITVVSLNPFQVIDTVVVGDVGGGTFPATDAEIGELFYFSGARFAIDGDQTCNHCHRDRGNISKPFSMPLLADSRGSRMTPAARGLLETRPWFFEGAMDENNFFPVINEFARAENFCCNDYEDDSDCATNPPADCAERDDPHSYPTRDAFFLARAREVIGRDRSFGGVIDTRLDYLGMTRLLGLFLLQDPAILPNPNRGDTPDAVRGRALFQSAATGCAGCHPAPGFAVSFEFNPMDLPLHFGPLITPNRNEDGTNLDLVHDGFLGTFPLSEQGDNDIHLNAPMLAGLWDRADRMLHDGRAQNLREALCTPGHPALLPRETGYNELDGILDTHGGTSHLSPGDLADLMSYLLTL